MIRSRLLKAGPRAVPGDMRSLGLGVWGELYRMEDRRDYVKAYEDRVWVQRCVDLKASSIKQVPIKAYSATKPDVEIERPHRIYDFFDSPCPRDPALMFFEHCMKSGQIIGDWFWELVPARDGGLAAAYPLRAYAVEIKPGQGGMPAGYVYRPLESDLELVEYDPVPFGADRVQANMVAAGRYYNPRDDWYGMPPLRGAKDDVISEYYAVRYDHRFFRNSARPDIILNYEKQLSKTENELERERWQEFKGVDNAHKAARMSGLKSLFELGKSPRDVQYLEGRKLAREGECGALGVPPVLVGILDHATYSNYELAQRSFWGETMVPELGFFASWANYVIVPFFPDVDRIEFDTSEVKALQESENEKAERTVKLTGRPVKTVNEGRDDHGLEPVDGGDVIYAPISMTPDLGDDVPESEPVPPQLQPPGNGDTIDGTAEEIPADQPQIEKARLLKSKLESTYPRMRDQIVRGTVTALRPRLKSHFADQRQRVMATVEGKSDADDLLKRLQAYGWEVDSEKLVAILQGLHLGVATASRQVNGELLGAEVSFDPDNPEITRLLAKLANRPDGIVTAAGRVKQAVIEEVQKGIALGLTNRQIATGGVFDVGPPGDRQAEQASIKGVQGVFDEYQTWQGERIARTEAATAFNVASAGAFREAGVTEVDIVDGDDDEPCASANGQRWPLEQYEDDPLGHPNCTRVGLPVIEVAAVPA